MPKAAGETPHYPGKGIEKIILPVIGAFMLAVSLFVGVLGAQGMKSQEDASLRYLPVQAEVLSSSVKAGSTNKVRQRRTEGEFRKTRQATKGPSPDIRYRYTVNGKTYESNQFAFFWNSTREDVEREVAQRPKGSKTQAWYNPDDPSEAVLYRNLDQTWIFYLASALGCLLGLGVIVVPFILRARKASRPSLE